MSEVFDALNAINVNDKTEKKKSGNTELTYLSWPFAWAEVKKRYPDAHYEIITHDGLPYVYDENTGYMVFTNVTIDGITHTMWLPVMDGANKAMKATPYSYKVKEYSNGKWTGGYSDKFVEAATMFDVNKTIMRCLVKNLAMFGLGLYIYAGEDLPEAEVEEQKAAQEAGKKKLEKITSEQVGVLRTILSENKINEKLVLDLYNLTSLSDTTNQKFEHIQAHLADIKKKQEEGN